MFTITANAGIWVQTHTIYYRAVESDEPQRADSSSGRKGKGQPTKTSSRRKPDLLWNGKYTFAIALSDANLLYLAHRND